MKQTLYIFISLFLSFIIILLPFFLLLFSQTFYHYEFNKLGVYEEENMIESKELNNKINESLQSLINFFLYKSNTISNYNENEISHMKDVKKIFLVLEILLILSLLILVLCMLKLSKQSLMQILKHSSIISLLFFLILFLLTINFEQTFAAFHPIFFPQGNYTFNPDTSFMKFMFPDDFFLDFLIKSLSISIVIAIIILFISYNASKRSHE